MEEVNHGPLETSRRERHALQAKSNEDSTSAFMVVIYLLLVIRIVLLLFFLMFGMVGFRAVLLFASHL